MRDCCPVLTAGPAEGVATFGVDAFAARAEQVDAFGSFASLSTVFDNSRASLRFESLRESRESTNEALAGYSRGTFVLITGKSLALFDAAGALSSAFSGGLPGSHIPNMFTIGLEKIGSRNTGFAAVGVAAGDVDTGDADTGGADTGGVDTGGGADTGGGVDSGGGDASGGGGDGTGRGGIPGPPSV